LQPDLTAPQVTISSQAAIAATTTTVPPLSTTAQGKQPVGGRGGGGGGGGGGGTGGGQPAQPAGGQVQTNGALKGQPPKPFMGKRGTVELFLQQFQIYRNANRRNESMIIPFDRCNLLLSMMAGRATQWAANKAEDLYVAVYGDAHRNPTNTENDEVLWDNLCIQLKNSFAEFHGAATASKKLVKLEQTPGAVEDYVADFERILAKSEWGRNDFGTIAAFKEGLIGGLLTALYRRRPQPATLDDWMTMAIEEEKMYSNERFDVAQSKARRGHGRLHDMAKDAERKASQRNKPCHDTDPCPYDPMEVDAAKTQRLSQEERNKLIKDGKCFGCKKHGHLYRDCPDRPPDRRNKGKGKERRKPFKPRACVLEASGSAADDEDSQGETTEEEETSKNAPPAYSKKDIMTAIKTMRTQDHDELVEELSVIGDSDF
jgi:hypothetical protein